MKAVLYILVSGACLRCEHFEKGVRAIDGLADYVDIEVVNAYDKKGAELVKRLDIKSVPVAVYDGRRVIGGTVGEVEAWYKESA